MEAGGEGVDGVKKLEGRSWKLEVERSEIQPDGGARRDTEHNYGRWRIEDGRWRMEDGGLKIDH